MSNVTIAFVLGIFASCGNDLRFDDFDIERSIGVVAGERLDAMLKTEQLFDGGQIRLVNLLGDISPVVFNALTR